MKEGRESATKAIRTKIEARWSLARIGAFLSAAREVGLLKTCEGEKNDFSTTASHVSDGGGTRGLKVQPIVVQQ